MKYDFDQIVDRRATDSSKWGSVKAVFGREDVLPLWVADMDFMVPKPVIDAIIKRAEHGIFGYPRVMPSVVEAIVERVYRKWGWKIEPDWVVFTPGVVPAVNVAVRAFTKPGDEVILQNPVYYPFRGAVTGNGCQIADNRLVLRNGRYEIDFEDLEKKFAPKKGLFPVPSRARMLIFCSPHNPVGRVWTRDEIVKTGEIVIRNGGIVVSDEIHCEIVYKGHEHIPFGAISDEFAQRSITCMAPSKTFNTAGLQASVIIIPNPEIRKAFNEARAGLVPSVNIFGLTALEAAFRYGDEWLEQLLDYLEGNVRFVEEYVAENIPEIKVIHPEGTYLMWLDCRGLGMNADELAKFMVEKARVGLDDGYFFGPGGEGFERLNIGCPRSILREALQRIENAVRSR